jgi:hypothetical protein
MPLPDVLVAEFRMAFTASWIASVPLEFVEVEELVPPNSWLSDSLVELLPKLDRSELIELVLIPFLLCASTGHGPGSGAPDSYLIGAFRISLSLGGRATFKSSIKG